MLQRMAPLRVPFFLTLLLAPLCGTAYDVTRHVQAEEFWPGGEFWRDGEFWSESEAAFMYGPVPIHPSPDPFTLNGYNAVQAIWMIRRARLLLWEGPDGSSEIIPIRENAAVRAIHVGTDEDAPGPQHRERYDIEVNGRPLDWRNTFIRYGGRMVNLQALFSYRNQTPPEGLRYRLER